MADKTKAVAEETPSVFTGINFMAVLAALLAFTLTKKYGQPVLDKAKLALPK